MFQLQFIELDMKQLAASCDGADKIEDIVKPLLQKRTLEEIGLDTVLQPKLEQESGPAKFFLETTPEEDAPVPKAEENEKEDERSVKENNPTIMSESVTKNQGNPEDLEKHEEDHDEKPIFVIKDEQSAPVAKIAAEPQLESIPEHADCMASESQHPIENDLKIDHDIQTATVHIDRMEKEEGNLEEGEDWGWGDEDAEEATIDEVKEEIEKLKSKKKSGKDE